MDTHHPPPTTSTGTGKTADDHLRQLPLVTKAYDASGPGEEPFFIEQTLAACEVLNTETPADEMDYNKIRTLGLGPPEQRASAAEELKEAAGRQADANPLRQRQARVNRQAIAELRQLIEGRSEMRRQWVNHWLAVRRSEAASLIRGLFAAVAASMMGLAIAALAADLLAGVFGLGGGIAADSENIVYRLALVAPFVWLLLTGLEFRIHAIDESARLPFIRRLSAVVVPVSLCGICVLAWKLDAMQDPWSDSGPPFWLVTVFSMTASSLVAFFAIRFTLEAVLRLFGYAVVKTKENEAVERWVHRDNLAMQLIEGRLAWHDEYEKSLNNAREAFVQENLLVLRGYWREFDLHIAAEEARTKLHHWENAVVSTQEVRPSTVQPSPNGEQRVSGA